jgi:hypothetical protein
MGPQQPRNLDLRGTLFMGIIGWFPGGDRLLYHGLDADKKLGLFELTLSTGENRRITTVNLSFGGALSPDGTRVAGCEKPGEKCAVFPLDGGPPRVIPGWHEGFGVLAWDPDGRSLYVGQGQVPLKVFRVRLEDGHAELWRELRPADGAGVAGLSSLVISPATGAYAYSYERVLSELYLVEGLK